MHATTRQARTLVLLVAILGSVPGTARASRHDLVLEQSAAISTANVVPLYAFERFLSDPRWSASHARGLLGFWCVPGPGMLGARSPAGRGDLGGALTVAALVASKVLAFAYPERDELMSLVDVEGKTRFALDLWTSSSMVLNVGARLRNGMFTTTVLVGLDPGKTTRRMGVGVGAGIHFAISGATFMELDLVTSALSPDLEGALRGGPGLLVQARLVLGARVSDGLSLYVGVSADTSVQWIPGTAGASSESPAYGQKALRPVVGVGPGFLVGLRLF